MRSKYYKIKNKYWTTINIFLTIIKLRSFKYEFENIPGLDILFGSFLARMVEKEVKSNICFIQISIKKLKKQKILYIQQDLFKPLNSTMMDAFYLLLLFWPSLIAKILSNALRSSGSASVVFEVNAVGLHEISMSKKSDGILRKKSLKKQ